MQLKTTYTSQRHGVTIPLIIELTPQLSLKQIVIPPVFAEKIRLLPAKAKVGVWTGLDYQETINSNTGQQVKQAILGAIFMELIDQQEEELKQASWQKPPKPTPQYHRRVHQVESDSMTYEMTAIRQTVRQTIAPIKPAVRLMVFLYGLINFLGFRLPIPGSPTAEQQNSAQRALPSPFLMRLEANY